MELPRLEPTPGELPALPPGSLSAFSDSVEPDSGPVRLRVVARLSGSGIELDFRDTDQLAEDAFVLTPSEALVAAAAAVADAVDAPRRSSGWSDRIALIGTATRLHATSPGPDPFATAMLMARVYDVVSGALAQAWPGRVGSGSCSLGAIVSVDGNVEVIDGGEGGQPNRAGRTDWPAPILERRALNNARGVDVEARVREGSGGGGARAGGDGQVRVYRFSEAATVRVAIDRRQNPPHGIDRAGPPLPARATLHREGHTAPIPVFSDVPVRPSDVLTIETAGGAGHGFPGYGEIEWDPSGWF